MAEISTRECLVAVVLLVLCIGVVVLCVRGYIFTVVLLLGVLLAVEYFR